MHRWWDGQKGEHYWMEVTERDDLGADLNAPREDETGKSQWSYELVREADDGDIVFHFHKPKEAIVAYSVIRDEAWEDEVVWGAKGTSARGREVQPYARPGFRRGLQGFTPLDPAVTLEEIRSVEDQVFALRESLEGVHGTPLYFPFSPYRGQSLRPYQGYMVKFPAGLLSILGLSVIPSEPVQEYEVRLVDQPPRSVGGASYRRADESIAVSRAEPLRIDPAQIERGLRGHRATQNALADALIGAGIEPLSPSASDPDWDIAWRSGDTLFVGEVKSLTDTNEERQLRLGIGQVLRYRQQVSAAGYRAKAVLVAERRPRDASWCALCNELGVKLVWPETWEALIPASVRSM
jgi:hypothetical protein